ncbi:hypothetical protein BD626DRAFT_587511 [Schizophyllum amplum]|uniref:Uncharacterized protein n=1 Tax=Schizophyllum amplum TaxID=97359 RepID=A0A550BU94_9AGAR|nr:hypothetical protein BD626DRAFT_587511 [Auriculariopsis ampla]
MVATFPLYHVPGTFSGHPFVEDLWRQRKGLPIAAEEKSLILSLIRSLGSVRMHNLHHHDRWFSVFKVLSGNIRDTCVWEIAGTQWVNDDLSWAMPAELAETMSKLCLTSVHASWCEQTVQLKAMYICLMGTFEGTWHLPPVLRDLKSVLIPVITPSVVVEEGQPHIHTDPPWRREPQWLLAMSVRVDETAIFPFIRHRLPIPKHRCPFVNAVDTDNLHDLCADNLDRLGMMQQWPEVRDKFARDLLAQTKISDLFKYDVDLNLGRWSNSSQVSFTPSRSQRAQANMALSTNGSAPPIHKANPFRARTKELVQAAASAAFSHRFGAKMGQKWGEKLKGAMP